MKTTRVLGFVLVVLALSVGVAGAAPESPLPTPEPTTEPGPYPPPTPGDDDSLRQPLLWVFGGGGAMVLGYWLMGNVGWLVGLPSEWKRYVGLGLPIVLAWLAFGAAVGLGYVDGPVDAQGWLEKLFALAGLAGPGAQAIHGRLQLRGRR